MSLVSACLLSTGFNNFCGEVMKGKDKGVAFDIREQQIFCAGFTGGYVKHISSYLHKEGFTMHEECAPRKVNLSGEKRG